MDKEESEENFFKPKLNDRQNMYYNTNNVLDYKRHFMYAKRYDNNRKILINKFYSEKSTAAKSSQKSTELLQRKKAKSFKKLFNLLDSDGDNLISAGQISLGKLNKSVVLILNPLIRELKNDGESLNEEEFVMVLEQLYKQLSFKERKVLLNFDKEEGDTVDFRMRECTFKPKINEYRAKLNLSYLID